LLDWRLRISRGLSLGTHDLDCDDRLVIEITNRAHRHLFAVLQLRKLLNDAVQASDLLLLLLHLDVFQFDRFVCAREHLFELHVVRRRLYQLALLLLTSGPHRFQSLLKTLNFFLEVFKLALKIPYLNFLIIKHFLALAELAAHLLLVVLEEVNLLFVASSLALLIANDFVVGLGASLQLGNLALRLLQTRL